MLDSFGLLEVLRFQLLILIQGGEFCWKFCWLKFLWLFYRGKIISCSTHFRNKK